MAIGRHLEVGVTSIAVHLFSQPDLPIGDLQITALVPLFVMAESLPWERKDTGLAVPIQQRAYSQIDLNEFADSGEKLVQRQARPGPVADLNRPGLVVVRTDPDG